MVWHWGEDPPLDGVVDARLLAGEQGAVADRQGLPPALLAEDRFLAAAAWRGIERRGQRPKPEFGD
jgi:hypothetical protein